MSPKKPTVRQRMGELWGSTSEARFRAKNFFLSKSIGLRLGVKPRPIPAIFENVSRSIHEGQKRILLVYPPKARNVSTARSFACERAAFGPIIPSETNH